MFSLKKFFTYKIPNFWFLFLTLGILIGFGISQAYKKYSEPNVEVPPVESPKIPDMPVTQNQNYLEKLTSKEWFWVETVMGSSVGIKPLDLTAFRLKFNKDLTFSSTSDCNNIGGLYEIFENKIKFKNIMQTKIYCMKSRESDFVEGLQNVSEILINDKNELILKYKDSTTFMRFR